MAEEGRDGTKPVFVLGLGAQKCGTTWLHRYLSRFDCANFGLLKEYHVWDARFSPLCRKFLVEGRTLIRPSRKNTIRYLMQRLDGFYEFYFRSLARRGYRITGDITPSYCLLTEDNLREVKARLETSGFTVKAIFLMRDPVERCWSAARMSRRLGLTGELSERHALERLYRTEQFQCRTRYEATVSAIEMVFPRHDICFGIYEELFTAEFLIELSNFLHVPMDSDFLPVRENVSPKQEMIDDCLKKEIFSFYEKTYRYCFEKFPQTRRLWNDLGASRGSELSRPAQESTAGEPLCKSDPA